jgi:hypothetical protein
MLVAVRSLCVPPAKFSLPLKASKVLDVVKAPNLRVLATAAYRIIKYGVTKKNSTHTSSNVVYEVYPPKNKNHERWFCLCIKIIDDKTFLGRWYCVNSTTELDILYPKPIVFRWCTVKRRVL